MTNAEIERLAERGMAFLRGVSNIPWVALALQTRNYSQAIHDEGWAMALRLNGFTPGALLPTGPADQQEATAFIDAWDEPNFGLVHDILDGNFPVQSAYLFADRLVPAKGAGSLGTVGTFIDRAVALRDGTDPKRAATRDPDRAAMDRLAERLVFTPAIEKTLPGKIATAKTLATVPLTTADTEQKKRETQATAKAFKIWLTEWRAIARAVVTRRDWLIRLGLASRRKAKFVEEPDPADLGVGTTEPTTPATPSA
jgi:hypothetical protein